MDIDGWRGGARSVRKNSSGMLVAQAETVTGAAFSLLVPSIAMYRALATRRNLFYRGENASEIVRARR